MTLSKAYILNIQCSDTPGIVSKVSAFLFDHECNIEESSQFHDPPSGQFFMRIVFTCNENSVLSEKFKSIAQEHQMDYNIYAMEQSLKTLIMVSKADHCLHDLLYRTASGQLNITIPAIVSNHNDCRDLAEQYNIPYHHLPITPHNKDEQETVLRGIIADTDTKLIVLARYMQILSSDMCAGYPGRMINIHHSFLPGFKGARPYHQAFERGVKMIGATAHFVTPDLDEGPIIEQDIHRISHADTADHLRDIGRDVEKRVLSHAVKLFTERRVFLHGNKTIIL